MSMKTFIVNKWSFLTNGIRRFAFPFIYTVLIAIVSAYTIIMEKDTDDMARLILALSLGFFVSILLTLLAERFKTTGNVYLFQALSVVATLGTWFAIKNYMTDAYVMMGYFGVSFAVIGAILFFLYGEKNQDLLAPHLLKGAVFSLAVAGILQAGLSLCITAFDAIIVDIPEMWKYIAVLGVFSGVIVATNLFLSGVPKPGESIVLPKVVKILLGLIGLPIYLLLVGILYVYLAKILITWNLPSNEINLYASLAALFFILFYLTIGSYKFENKLIALFMKWGKYALIPIILMQLYAIYLRVSAYGITILRYTSIILVAIVLVFLLLAIYKKGKYLKGIFAVIAAAAIIFTFTPLNIIDVPDKVQFNRLVSILEENQMYENGKVVAKANVSADDKSEITNIFEYLVRSGGDKIDLIASFRPTKGSNTYSSGDFKETFGFSPTYDGVGESPGTDAEYFSTTFLYTGLAIHDFSKFISDVTYLGNQDGKESSEINEQNKVVSVENENGDVFTVDVFAVMDQIYKMGSAGNGTLKQEMKVPIDGGDYFVTDISFRKEGGNYYLQSLDGFVMK